MNAEHIPMYRKWLAAGLVGLIILAGSAVSQQSFAQSIDYDADDDNLIEVDSLAKLNAIRYDLDGNGMPSNMSAYATAFPTPATSMGCPTTCEGYELMADLDFDTDGSGDITSNDDVLSWGNGRGWQPIGQTGSDRFATEFHGNGHTISHLFIRSTNTDFVGLVGQTEDGVLIHSVGMIGVNVTGDVGVGSLVGNLGGGFVHTSYATGEVNGTNQVGGLVGFGGGAIYASYATCVVNGNSQIGGLVGVNSSVSGILANYATGEVSGNSQIGGLVGVNTELLRVSYATGEVSGNSQIGGLVGVNISSTGGRTNDSYFDSDTFGSTGNEGTSTVVLQSPTGYDGIYANWNVDLDGNSTTDDPWDFGTNEQYPILQVDFNGDGVKSWQEFGPQSRPGFLVSPVELSLTEGTTGIYTVVLVASPTAASVTVTPMSSDPAVSVSSELTFTSENWDMEQTVTVSAEEDDNSVGEMVSLTNTVTESSAGNYASVTASNVRVNVTDNTPGVAVSPGDLSLPEGTTGSYTVVLLTTPTATVTVTPISNTPAAVSVVSSGTTFTLTFTNANWDTPQTVVVSAEEDNNVVSEMVSLMHTVGESSAGNYASVTAPDVTVNVTDNDSPVSVSTGTLSLMEGTTGSYTVVLLGEPTTPSVTVTPVVTAVSGNTTAVRVSGPLTFTNTNWDTRQTVVVGAVEDINTASEVVRLTHTVSASPNYGPALAPVVTVNVTDSGERGIRVRVRVFLEGPLR